MRMASNFLRRPAQSREMPMFGRCRRLTLQRKSVSGRMRGPILTRDKRKPQGKHDEWVNQTAPSHSEEKEPSSTAIIAIGSWPSRRQVTLDVLLDQAPQKNGRKHSTTHRA